MIDKLKENWKTVLVGTVVAVCICWGIWGCETQPAEEVKAVEAPVEVVPEVTPEVVPEEVVE